MQMAEQYFRFSWQYIEPGPRLLEAAQKLADSPDEDRRAVAKALLDVTAAGRKIQDAMGENRDVDLAPYFDFWFADAVSSAEKLLQADDQETRQLARCVIDAEKAIIKSKESFLVEQKRLGIKPNRK
jgi:hypothetical protein